MAGRRWAQGRPTGEAQPSVPRPSERRQAPDAAQQPKRPKAPKAPKPAPQVSEEALARAKARMTPPKAPWHPLPLAEAAIVLGLLAILLSAILTDRDGIYAGFLLILLGTAEFSWREHRHGYRSHATILGAIIGFIVGGTVFQLTDVSRNACIGVGIVVFLLAWSAFDGNYKSAGRREAEAREAEAREAAAQAADGTDDAKRP